ncbi:TetR/AcrR family transcriptional regulator [Actinoallomurus iriomotensis]|uniref:TetR family transcriptional regulator n=1 Tax=Actinoallomurus iriomotensis TaxID=478107 RepID=A0A9W6SFY8_9ACTN|nr:TetR/AcrR family transcriptional regulator [Actinoallomurus iriomotensis]GLY92718.1 TetR family transcriptional regulator [Actinoallomurus iriomotensis]
MDNVAGDIQEPPAADRRARQRERTRHRILEAALELFSARGYAHTTMDDIAGRADIARRTLFNHFPAKQAILAAWRAERGERLAAALPDAAAEGDGPPVPAAELLRRQFAVLGRLSESDVPLTIVLVQGRMTEIGDAGEPFPTFESLRAVVQLGQDRAEFSTTAPAHTVAEVLSSCYADTVSRWALPQVTGRPAPFELGPALSAKLELVLGGLAAGASRY